MAHSVQYTQLACRLRHVVLMLFVSLKSFPVFRLTTVCFACRAHYSAGQIHALQHQWQQSETHYRLCADLTADPQSRGQALYCVGVAAHHLGRHRDALDAYAQALDVDTIKPMVVLGQARALKATGQVEQAVEVAGAFLRSDQARGCPPVVIEALNTIKGKAE